MYLVNKIIERCEYHSARDWKEGVTGNRTMDITEEDHKKCGGLSLFMEEAKALIDMGLIQPAKREGWAVYGSDIGKISFRVENLDKFYEIAEKESLPDKDSVIPKRERVRRCRELLEKELERGIQKTWIADYYKSLLTRLERLGDGKIPGDFQKMDLYISCFRGLDQLEEPMFKRVFSKKYLNDSKKFENEAESHIISVAKRFCDEVECDMDDTAVLSQILIKEYAQEMALKGPLKLRIRKGEEVHLVDLSGFVYGLVLNNETLRHVELELEQPEIKRVITVENKANFVSLPYQNDTLYIFSHGYFAPDERKFLKELRIVLQHQRENDKRNNPAGFEAEYYHTGDLDYGGVKIFEYTQKRIFPELKPMMMDVETFTRYQKYAEPISDKTMEKLKNVEIPALQDLIDTMIANGMGIEQESFLID